MFAPYEQQTSEQLTLFAADSPVRISATPARAPASTVSAAGCGESSPDLLASYDPATRSWRTSQLCLDGAWQEFSGTWPRSGMTRSGTLYQLPPLVRLTDATESGSLPTPSQPYGTSNNGCPGDGRMQYRLKGKPSLETMARWGLLIPTPTAGDSKSACNSTATRCGPWPTPAARDWRSESCSPEYRAERDSQTRGQTLGWEVGGSLNPGWVEWLMGFPLGWTVCERSATASFRKSPS